jgi:hypothetical protein
MQGDDAAMNTLAVEVDPNVALIAPLVVTLLVALLTIIVQYQMARQTRSSETERQEATQKADLAKLEIARRTDLEKLELGRRVEEEKQLLANRADAYVRLLEYQLKDEAKEENNEGAVTWARIYAYGSVSVTTAMRAYLRKDEGAWEALIDAVKTELGPEATPTLNSVAVPTKSESS